MEYKVDYHIHTYYSDGISKPTDIVKKRKNEEYDIIAITDHDGVSGVKEAEIAGDALGIKVVPGIELSTRDENGIEYHILGYNIDCENEELLSTIEYLNKTRKENNAKILKALDDLGYHLEPEEYIVRKGQEYVGKPHFARAFIKQGKAKDIKDAFRNIFAKPEIRQYKQEVITPEKAMEVIKVAGGIPVLAHPGKIKKIGEKGTDEWKENVENIVKRFKKQGLKGIECFRPSHDEAISGYLAKLASKYHLHMTEGSDYHGD